MLKMGGVVQGSDDVRGAFAILSVLGDDNKFKQRLQKLVDLAKEAEDHHAVGKAAHEAAVILSQTAQKFHAEAEKLHAEAVSHKENAEKAIVANTADIAKREAELEATRKQHWQDLAVETANQKLKVETREKAHEESVAAANKRFLKQQQELDASSKTLSDREAAVSAREAAVAQIEKAHKELADKLAYQQSALDAKHAKLRDIIG